MADTPEQIAKRQKLNGQILTFGCLPTLILVIVLAFLPGSSDSDSSSVNKQISVTTEDHSSAAYVTSKDFVKQAMNFPEEADFDWTPQYNQKEGDENYRIVGSVLGKNAYGVKIRQTFKCVLHYNGGDEMEDNSWEVVEPVSFE